MVELREFIGNFFLELIGLIAFYQRSPMDFFYFLIRASVQLHFTIYQINKLVQDLMADSDVTKKAGIFEYVLGGEKDPKLLSIRQFSDNDKKSKYKSQTNRARKEGTSNCPICNTDKKYKHTDYIWKYKEMEGDHIKAWSDGGRTELSNLQMLCKHHNSMKSNY